MKYEVNECCDCAVPGYPCLGYGCSLRHVVKYKCDMCYEEDLNEDEIIDISNMHVCKECYETGLS